MGLARCLPHVAPSPSAGGVLCLPVYSHVAIGSLAVAAWRLLFLPGRRRPERRARGWASHDSTHGADRRRRAAFGRLAAADSLHRGRVRGGLLAAARGGGTAVFAGAVGAGGDGGRARGPPPQAAGVS